MLVVDNRLAVNMSKRFREAPGFYTSHLNDDPVFKKKYRPESKPVVMGSYQVERVVARRIRGTKCEYFIKWLDYSSSDNTWELEDHLPEELITAFTNPSVDPVRIDVCRERLALLLERGLKSRFQSKYEETLVMRHDAIRCLLPQLPLDLQGSYTSVTEKELCDAGLASSLHTLFIRFSNKAFQNPLH